MSVARKFSESAYKSALPASRALYFGGQWREPSGGYAETYNPANGESLGKSAVADGRDVDAAVQAAKAGFASWRHSKPLERGAMLRRIAAAVRENARELALIDAANCGNPVAELMKDTAAAAAYLDLFAGIAPEAKGSTVPMGQDVVNYTQREPVGVVARIVAYNHPLLFLCAKLAPAVAAGNCVIMKPPTQAPLSAYRLMELVDGVLPPGVLNVVTGGVECGAALTTHPDVPMITLVGSAQTGRAIMRQASDRLKRLVFELGGKNALVVYPDADIPRTIAGAVKGMNFGWAGQSCGSTSRLFLHHSVYDEVLDGVIAGARSYRPGVPTDDATNMGSLISAQQRDKVLGYIQIAKDEGARPVLGGGAPVGAAFERGFFVEPTIFVDVDSEMRVAKEEIFGPVLSVIRWRDEEDMLRQVNSVEYGLTAAVFTTSLANAHRAASRIEAGYIWVNNTSLHFPGAPFGGYKQSGFGREESIDELLEFTQLKNINITL